MAKGIALKCTYNNGGEGGMVGFAGTCSDDIIAHNIRSGRVWCSNKESPCRKFMEGGFAGRRPIRPCYESWLFEDGEFSAGVFQGEVRHGEPMHLSDVSVGDVAIVTTRFPGDREEDRRVVGLFRIGRIESKPTDTYSDGG